MNYGLKNKVIVITRSEEQSDDSIKKFESLGAIVIPFPTIKIRPIETFNMFDNYANQLDKFDYIIFTSENAVKYAVERLKEIRIDLPSSLSVVCVGKKTASVCKELDIKVDIVPNDFSAKGLLNHFKEIDITNNNIFIPSSTIAPDELKVGLIELGAKVVKTPIYDVGLPDENDIEESKKMLQKETPDLFIFTSPSTYNNFLKILQIEDAQNYFADYLIAAIGPTTKEAIEISGVKIDIIPKNFTMNDLIKETVKYYSEKENITT
ncbi:MAG: uroporphyrinogen-III synthase [Melioribacteraceae bacterium]|nr:MAG: uroporphyrinogen-III synthase [Melioribacteraceae bacterium]